MPQIDTSDRAELADPADTPRRDAGDRDAERPDPDPGQPDRTTRQAALWATVVALPLTVLVGVLIFVQLSPDPAPKPTPSPSAARPASNVPVPMAAPTLADWPATVCRAFLARMPDNLFGQQQRPVTAGPEQNAAYGDPALTVACGVPAPKVRPTERLWTVNQVCWQATPGETGLVLTTVDREVPIRLTVPPGHEQTLKWALPVSEAVALAVKSTPDAPSGCQD